MNKRNDESRTAIFEINRRLGLRRKTTLNTKRHNEQTRVTNDCSRAGSSHRSNRKIDLTNIAGIYIIFMEREKKNIYSQLTEMPLRMCDAPSATNFASPKCRRARRTPIRWKI